MMIMMINAEWMRTSIVTFQCEPTIAEGAEEVPTIQAVAKAGFTMPALEIAESLSTLKKGIFGGLYEQSTETP